MKYSDSALKSLAARAGHKELAELLISRGSAVNAAVDGHTPLHDAAEQGNKAVTEVLLANGGDIEARDYTGRTPLHRAAALGKSTDLP